MKLGKFESAEKSLSFHDFNQNPEYTGIYISTDTFENPQSKNENDKFITAHVFCDENGEEIYIGDSYLVNRTIEKAKSQFKDFAIKFEFLGKDTVNGKPFNRFKTFIAEVLQDKTKK